MHINGKELCLYLTDKNGAIDRPPFRSISLEDATDEELEIGRAHV